MAQVLVYVNYQTMFMKHKSGETKTKFEWSPHCGMVHINENIDAASKLTEYSQSSELGEVGKGQIR